MGCAEPVKSYSRKVVLNVKNYEITVTIFTDDTGQF
jgi:hypothetical protein